MFCFPRQQLKVTNNSISLLALRTPSQPKQRTLAKEIDTQGIVLEILFSFYFRTAVYQTEKKKRGRVTFFFLVFGCFKKSLNAWWKKNPTRVCFCFFFLSQQIVGNQFLLFFFFGCRLCVKFGQMCHGDRILAVC